MFCTKQERFVLVSLAAIFLVGIGTHYAFKKNPQLGNYINLLESDRIYYKVDLNRATAEDLVRIPYIGKSTAKSIIKYRERHGPFQNLEQLKSVKGIRSKNFEHFHKYLKLTFPHNNSS